jgi:hypothetical protein
MLSNVLLLVTLVHSAHIASVRLRTLASSCCLCSSLQLRYLAQYHRALVLPARQRGTALTVCIADGNAVTAVIVSSC